MSRKYSTLSRAQQTGVVFMCRYFENLAYILQNYINDNNDGNDKKVCMFADYLPCKRNPCRNGATCKSDDTSYTCYCKIVNYGTHCESKLTTFTCVCVCVRGCVRACVRA